jgi:hypothetical protein
VAVQVRKSVNGSAYQAIYRTVDGKQKSAGTFSTKREADAAYLEAMAKVLRGIDPSAETETVYPAAVSGGITVSAFAEQWLPNTSSAATPGRSMSGWRQSTSSRGSEHSRSPHATPRRSPDGFASWRPRARRAR